GAGGVVARQVFPGGLRLLGGKRLGPVGWGRPLSSEVPDECGSVAAAGHQLRPVRTEAQRQNPAGVPGGAAAILPGRNFHHVDSWIIPPARPCQQSAVRREGHRADAVGELGLAIEYLSGSQIAYFEEATLAAESDQTAIRRDRGEVDRTATHG